MRALEITSLILIIIGGLNWGLVGLFNFNLVTAIFGAGSVLTTIVYIIIALAAIYQIMPLSRHLGMSTAAKTNH